LENGPSRVRPAPGRESRQSEALERGEMLFVSPEAILFGGGTLDAESEAASRGTVDLQIVGARLGKQFFDDGLEFAIRHVFLC